MARTYRILGQVNPAANTMATANLDEAVANGGAFRISVNTASAAVSNASYIAYGVNVPGRDAITLTLGVTLNAGSILSVNANSSLLSFSAFGTEIY